VCSKNGKKLFPEVLLLLLLKWSLLFLSLRLQEVNVDHAIYPGCQLVLEGCFADFVLGIDLHGENEYLLYTFPTNRLLIEHIF
jgi:hypothetical protein